MRAEKTATEVFKFGKNSEHLPSEKILNDDVEKGIKILELLVDYKIMNSKSEARRAIKNNGIKVNDMLVTDENMILGFANFKDKNMKISFGKKKHFIFKVT